MRNVTISLDYETARWARIEAARRDKSLPRFVSEVLRDLMTRPDACERVQQSYLSREPIPLGSPGQRYPSRDELHQRRPSPDFDGLNVVDPFIHEPAMLL